MVAELLIDNFAGGGGASTGIEAAMERPIDIAINHDLVAIAMHKVNHPHTKHLCESVWDVDPVKECAGRPVGLAWFSPDCKHFSKAKGGKPVEKSIRGLAWVVLRWARMPKWQRPRIIMLENVEEFITWGPLIEKDGKMYPDAAKAGQTFNAFINALKKQGYKVEYRQLRACDYGAPTIRKRLFLIARCDGQPIVWPEPTHGDPKSEAVKSGRLKPWRTAAECIDWSIPAPSIFERKKPLAEATQRRIAKGIMKYVVNAADPFIVTYYGDKGGGEFRGGPLAEPLRTQTTENRHALVVPYLTEHANASKQRVMPIDEPWRTICAQTKGGHFALVSPLLVHSAHGEKGTNGSKRWGKGSHELKDPLQAITGKGNQALVSAFLTKFRTGSTGSALTEPIHTLTAGGEPERPSTGNVMGLVSANLIRNMGKSVGARMDEPARIVLAGEKDALITSHLVKLKGTNIGQDEREPLHTVTAGGLHFGEVRAFLIKYFGCGENSRDLRDVVPTVTAKERFGLVTVHGEEYQIMDIGMRMLTPRELFRAQGFPDSYIIEKGCFTDDFSGSKELFLRPITKTEQVAKCGNSVCPDMAYALVRANMGVRSMGAEAVQ